MLNRKPSREKFLRERIEDHIVTCKFSASRQHPVLHRCRRHPHHYNCRYRCRHRQQERRSRASCLSTEMTSEPLRSEVLSQLSGLTNYRDERDEDQWHPKYIASRSESCVVPSGGDFLSGQRKVGEPHSREAAHSDIICGEYFCQRDVCFREERGKHNISCLSVAPQTSSENITDRPQLCVFHCCQNKLSGRKPCGLIESCEGFQIGHNTENRLIADRHETNKHGTSCAVNYSIRNNEPTSFHLQQTSCCKSFSYTRRNKLQPDSSEKSGLLIAETFSNLLRHTDCLLRCKDTAKNIAPEESPLPMSISKSEDPQDFLAIPLGGKYPDKATHKQTSLLALSRYFSTYFLVFLAVFQNVSEAMVIPSHNKDHQVRSVVLSENTQPLTRFVREDLPFERFRRSPAAAPAAQNEPRLSGADSSLSSKSSSSPISSNTLPSRPTSNYLPSSTGTKRSSSSSPVPAAHKNSASDKSAATEKLVEALMELGVLQGGSLGPTSPPSNCLRVTKILHQLAVDGDTASSGAEPSSPLSHIELLITFEESPLLDGNTTTNSTAKRSPGTKNPVLCSMDPVIVDVNVEDSSEEEEAKNATVIRPQKPPPNAQGPMNSGITSLLRTNKLSRTQIVVISTCGAIIGMFFLIAGFLRIRNYIKRRSLEQAQANRPKFRSCSVALRNPTNSMEQLRRDSLASKGSHQNSVTTKGSNYSQTNASSSRGENDSSASSPRHDPDTTPLLVITRAPPPNNVASPADPATATSGNNGGISAALKDDTPHQSNSSLQFIDEDISQRKKALVQSSLVKNSSGEGGGYTICLNNGRTASLTNGRHCYPKRPSSLATGTTEAVLPSKVHPACKEGETPSNGAGARQSTDPECCRMTEISPRADNRSEGASNSPAPLLSPLSTSTCLAEGSVNPSFSSGSLAAAGGASCSKAAEVGQTGFSNNEASLPQKWPVLREDISGSTETITTPSGSRKKRRRRGYQPVKTEDEYNHRNSKSKAANSLPSKNPGTRDKANHERNKRQDRGQSPTVYEAVRCVSPPHFEAAVQYPEGNQLPKDVQTDRTGKPILPTETHGQSTHPQEPESRLQRPSGIAKEGNESIGSNTTPPHTPDSIYVTPSHSALPSPDKTADPIDDSNQTDSTSAETSRLRQQSSFGLTQSDSSVTSAANQGKEFSGQTEYYPNDVDLDLYCGGSESVEGEQCIDDDTINIISEYSCNHVQNSVQLEEADTNIDEKISQPGKSDGETTNTILTIPTVTVESETDSRQDTHNPVADSSDECDHRDSKNVFQRDVADQPHSQVSAQSPKKAGDMTDLPVVGINLPTNNQSHPLDSHDKHIYGKHMTNNNEDTVTNT